jgi:hypothetical protein
MLFCIPDRAAMTNCLDRTVRSTLTHAAAPLHRQVTERFGQSVDLPTMGDPAMKTLSIITAAIFLGLSGAAMAGDSGENHQDNTSATGPNPFMPEFSTHASPGYSAFGQYPVHPHVVHRHVEM